MTDVLIPGGRDVRGRLEEPDFEADAIVVVCPPHPQQGGSSTDPRLLAVTDALETAGIASLRFEYGPWDVGYGELEDVRNAVRWAAERYDRVGLFGYSFGGGLALLAADGLEGRLESISVLAPPTRLAEDLDALRAYDGLELPAQVCYGERDQTVESDPIVECARAREDEVRSVPADHFFLGTQADIASAVASFFERTLLEES